MGGGTGGKGALMTGLEESSAAGHRPSSSDTFAEAVPIDVRDGVRPHAEQEGHELFGSLAPLADVRAVLSVQVLDGRRLSKKLGVN